MHSYSVCRRLKTRTRPIVINLLKAARLLDFKTI